MRVISHRPRRCWRLCAAADQVSCASPGTRIVSRWAFIIIWPSAGPACRHQERRPAERGLQNYTQGAFWREDKGLQLHHCCQAFGLKAKQLRVSYRLNSGACCLQVCGDHPVLGNWEVEESPGAALMSAACSGRCRKDCAWHRPACPCMGCLGSARNSAAQPRQPSQGRPAACPFDWQAAACSGP